jgi:TfoX/Sxy family transcriptional regulator of competence genes
VAGSKNERIQELAAALSTALAAVQPEAHLDWKAMFGGAGFYVDGTMFAAWYGASIALKLPEDARAELLRVDGAVQAQSPQYVEVPPAWIEDTRALEPWVARSIAYVKAAKPKKRKRTT